MKMSRVLVILLPLAVGAVLVLKSLWTSWSDAESRTACKANLKLIGVALHSYHDTNAHFPAAYSSSLPPHSWRVALLPWMDQQSLFQTYNQAAAWNENGNLDLLGQRPINYACPEVIIASETSYQAVASIRTPWPYDSPTRISDFTDGTSNTLMLLDVHNPEVPWTEPKDLTLEQAAKAVEQGQEHVSNSERGLNVLLADGSVRYISRKVSPDIFHGLLTPSGGTALPMERLSKETQLKAAEETLLAAPAAFGEPVDCALLPATQMLPSAVGMLQTGQTTVYCPTMALAWKRYVAAQPQVAFTALGRELIENPFSEADIDTDDLEITTTTEDGALKAICKLKKHLAFESEFEAFKLPLTFSDNNGAHRVRSFGVTSHWYEWRAALAQIRVIDYRSPDDFVVAIANLSGEDLVLAKIPQPATMETGLTDITQRIRDSRLPPEFRSVVAEEDVVIPVLQLSVSASFENELNHEDQLLGPRVEQAYQIIQFRLDERGAVVWSEAVVIGENGSYDYTPGTRKFIFDKPFLIMLREAPDKHPYFAAWIGNTDLMLAPGGE